MVFWFLSLSHLLYLMFFLAVNKNLIEEEREGKKKKGPISVLQNPKNKERKERLTKKHASLKVYQIKCQPTVT